MSYPAWVTAQWKEDCLHWHGVVLVGEFAHWCTDWDSLPLDETCEEFMCCHCDWGDGTLAATEAQDEVRAKYRAEHSLRTAGPDLYKALKAIIESGGWTQQRLDAIAMAHAALAKAEGRSAAEPPPEAVKSPEILNR